MKSAIRSSKLSGSAAIRTPILLKTSFAKSTIGAFSTRTITYAAGKPGWKTDRGHVYISFGKPDDIESHPSGGMYQRPQDEGGGSTSTFPFEIWHYRYIEGIGENVNLEFVDTCQCGDYPLHHRSRRKRCAC